MALTHKVKAVVRNGRLTVDEPTNLPEGEVVELVSADDPYAYLDHDDEMDEDERQRLNASIECGIQEARAGLGRPAEEVINDLRQRE